MGPISCNSEIQKEYIKVLVIIEKKIITTAHISDFCFCYALDLRVSREGNRKTYPATLTLLQLKSRELIKSNFVAYSGAFSK